MSLKEPYLLKLQQKPSEIESHSWADYLELLCLANIDGELSESDIIDRLAIRQRDFKEGDTEDIKEEKELDSDNGYTASNRARISDKWETKLRDWFGILAMRCTLYKEYYPFKLSGRELKLKSKKATLKQRLYVYLVLCSSLNLFPKRISGKLSNSFELLSMEAFKGILPKEAQVHLFGKNPYNTKGYFNTNNSLWKKMNNLADKLNESLTQKIQEIDYPASNKGDDGLDIVAWIPTMDNLPSKIVFFGQCACGTEWRKKQHESSFDAWSNKIDLTNYIINNIFIPYCFRKSNGGWHKPGSIQKAFLLDRKRILDFSCKRKILNYKILPASDIIDEIHDLKEEIV